MKKSQPWIQTYTGHAFPLLDPKPDDFKLVDIAHALSNICRYTGHCSRFYSVAEHSVRVAFYLQELVRRELKPLDGALTLQGAFRAGLMHDATEAYLTDISSPLKRTPWLAGYRDAENMYHGLIAKKFNLSTFKKGDHDLLRDADLSVLELERDALMGKSQFPWEPFGCLPRVKSARLPDKLSFGWSPTFAKAKFLRAAKMVGLL